MPLLFYTYTESIKIYLLKTNLLDKIELIGIEVRGELGKRVYPDDKTSEDGR